MKVETLEDAERRLAELYALKTTHQLVPPELQAEINWLTWFIGRTEDEG